MGYFFMELFFRGFGFFTNMFKNIFLAIFRLAGNIWASFAGSKPLLARNIYISFFVGIIVIWFFGGGPQE